MWLTLRCAQDIIVELDLSWNYFSPKGCADILSQLVTDDCLKVLSLSWNRVGDRGGAVLAPVFAHNQTLEKIDLSNCGISGRFAKDWVASLQENTTLQILKVDNNHLGYEGGYLLSAALSEKDIRYSMAEQGGVSERMGVGASNADIMVASYMESNPTARWRLQLSDPKHRVVAVQLMNAAEQFDGECWRNEKFNGHRFTYKKGWTMPLKGWLELDFIHLDPNDPEIFGVMVDKDFQNLCTILTNLR